MNSMSLKGMFAGVMSGSGIMNLIEQIRFSERAPVLMYHRILSDRAGNSCHVQPGMYVSGDTFEQQLRFLQERFRVVFLDELLERSRAGKSLSGLCAITFDDGWIDNYTEAFPLLQRYEVPATIFLATGFIGTQRLFWPEELSRCLEHVDPQQLISKDVPIAMQHLGLAMTRLERGDWEQFMDSCIALMKGISPQGRQDMLSHLSEMVGGNPPDRQMLNWEEVRSMAASGLVRFGSHTVNHELLDQLAPDAVRQEIADSCVTIVEQLGVPAQLFAYPNGNYSSNVKAILDEQGLCGAVTTMRGLVEKGISPLEIPRISIHEDVGKTVSMFRSRMVVPFF